MNVSGDAEHLDLDEDVTQTTNILQQPTLNNKDITAMKADMVGSKAEKVRYVLSKHAIWHF